MKIPLWCKASLLIILIVLVGCQQTPEPDPDVTITPVPAQTTSTPGSGVIIRLTGPGAPVHVGDTVEVGIEIDRSENLSGAEVHLQYDAKLLQVEDAQPDEEGVQVAHGSFLQPDFVAINKSDNLNGVVDYAIAQMPPHTPANGDGQLCTLRLKAVSAGISDIDIIEVVLADPSAQQIPVAMLIGTLTIKIEE